MSDDYSVCTNSYSLSHTRFDSNDARPNGKVRESMHGKVKIYTKDEIDELNEIRGLTK